ncbi:MAG: dihydroneopterin aldolase [Candidatus Margulisiibacteriota bacterium]
MSSTLWIRDFTVSCIVGVHPHERTEPQPLILSLGLDLDITQAAKTDDLAHTFDYDALTQSIGSWLVQTHFNLIETVAVRLADFVLTTCPNLTQVAVVVEKPKALAHAKVSVHYTQSR